MWASEKSGAHLYVFDSRTRIGAASNNRTWPPGNGAHTRLFLEDSETLFYQQFFVQSLDNSR
jgi:hypothetical protein